MKTKVHGYSIFDNKINKQILGIKFDNCEINDLDFDGEIIDTRKSKSFIHVEAGNTLDLHVCDIIKELKSEGLMEEKKEDFSDVKKR
jgi:hypothetical protein